MNDLRSSHFVTDNTLLYFRLTAGFWGWFITIWNWAAYGGQVFRFMTFLSWLGLTIYFSETVYYSIKPLTGKGKIQEILWKIHRLLFCNAMVLPIFVTIVHWSIDRKDSYTELIYSNPNAVFMQVSMHVTNLISSLTELFLTTQSLEKMDFIYPAISCVLYSALSAILRYSNYEWPYSLMKNLFSDPFFGSILVFTFCLIIFVVIIFYLAFGLFRFRKYLCKKYSLKSSSANIIVVTNDSFNDSNIQISDENLNPIIVVETPTN